MDPITLDQMNGLVNSLCIGINEGMLRAVLLIYMLMGLFQIIKYLFRSEP